MTRRVCAPRTCATDTGRIQARRIRGAGPREPGADGGREVTALLVNHDDDLVDLVITTPEGRSGVLHTTSKHPFWVDTKKTWISAGKLREGDALITPSGAQAHVRGVSVVPGEADMYNLTVDGLHTYYVLAGSTPVLVHNSDGNASIEDFRGGYYFHYPMPTAQGSVDIGAFVEIEGNMLTLDNVSIYGSGR
ncbi:polymorphic toxin-type HINT domain-containing protein [Streptomyces sp. NPDC086989]|uniref:polymorphic toxin-type HINT domain-containing protein n=1 Tax=Streptomyces sp. NPDC086989 TaxID=3365764 RepID=UPI00380DCC74